MAFPTAICVIFGMTGVLLVLLEVGQRMGKAPRGTTSLSTIDGAVFALMGLLIAFTFSGAATRFEGRRHLIVQEANAISTAYLRVDVLSQKDQPSVRQDLREYVDARIAYYRNFASNKEVASQQQARVTALQNKLWKECVLALPPGDSAAKSLMLSALNEMIDITTTRLWHRTPIRRGRFI